MLKSFCEATPIASLPAIMLMSAAIPAAGRRRPNMRVASAACGFDRLVARWRIDHWRAATNCVM